MYAGLLPTALFAAPEGAVNETTFIFLVFKMLKLLILGVSEETFLKSIFNDFSCLLKWYSGPFLLFPPVSNKVSTPGFLFK